MDDLDSSSYLWESYLWKYCSFRLSILMAISIPFLYIYSQCFNFKFFTSMLADGHQSVRDSKSPQFSRTLLSILAVLNNLVVLMVSTRPPISKSSRPFNNPLVTVPKALIMISKIVTFYYYYYYTHLKVLHTSFSRWFSTGVGVTASLLKSPGHLLL